MGFRNILSVFMLSILLVMFYIFIMDNKESRQSTERTLFRAISNLQTLQEQNAALISIVAETRNKLNACEADTRKLKSYLTKATETFERMSAQAKDSIPSIGEEIARREVGRSTSEFLRYMTFQLHGIFKLSTNYIQRNEITRIIYDSVEFQGIFKSNMHKLTNTADGHEQWRRRESEKIGDLVQRRLKYLQNPNNCNDVKKMICTFKKQCGFGCQLHRVVHCLIMAYATHRTLVFKSVDWAYAKKGWTATFLPLGIDCLIHNSSSSVIWKDTPQVGKAPVVLLLDLEFVPNPPSYIPLSVPSDLVNRILHFHGNPAVWWVGQIVKYAMRPNADLEEFLTMKKMNLEFKNPIVGIQIRRTDKLRQEAQLHFVEEYMKHVNDWYEMYEKKKPVIKRRVYIATDDPGVFVEASEKYPQYTFLYDKNASMLASMETRYSEESLRGVILDINMLSMCDFIVCTFSSQVCRAAYELMQTRHGDASQKFKSLDDIYYFGGQRSHRFRMTENHNVNKITDIQRLNQSNSDMILPNGQRNVLNIKRNESGIINQRANDNIEPPDEETINGHKFSQLELDQKSFKQKTKHMTDLSVSKDDMVDIHGNLWNGFSVGKNVITGQVGYFPSYKAVDIVQHVKMPTYSNIPDL